MIIQPDVSSYGALLATPHGFWHQTASGAVHSLNRDDACRLALESPLVLCNAALTGHRMGITLLSGLDLLELFAFIRPTHFCVPTPHGLAHSLGLDPPQTSEAEVRSLRHAAHILLTECAQKDWPFMAGAATHLKALERLKWPWAPLLSHRLASSAQQSDTSVFQDLPEWEDAAPRPRPADVTLPHPMVSARLHDLTAHGEEDRPQQQDYARAVSFAFHPREMDSAPNVVLAEAGTGTGKTLGYLAPASLWAAQAQGTVWISTHTKALQRQLDQELTRLFPHPATKSRTCVVRKGRENYACLLNLEDSMKSSVHGRSGIFAHIAARWARYTRDGDMIGGDFPAWLSSLFRNSAVISLTDRRGECIYSACTHYRKCFIERAHRKSLQADIVVANHALVMINAAQERPESQAMQRIIFDEGHHVFDAADSIFSTHLSGYELIELRRWILGSDGRARNRGLKSRLSDIALNDSICAQSLDHIVHEAQILPGTDWLVRIQTKHDAGPFEALLAATRQHVLARSPPDDAGYSLEAQLYAPSADLLSAAHTAHSTLMRLSKHILTLEERLNSLLQDPPEWLDKAIRVRIDGALNGIHMRRRMIVAWGALLASLGQEPEPRFIDWAEITRMDGAERDVGLHRHWLDPTEPLAQTLLQRAHGVVITSATLRDRVLGDDGGWAEAEMRTGAQHLALPPKRFYAPSPFDYATATRIFIVTDIKRGNIAALTGAYKGLIEAAGGGTLGLFTAIARLKAVYERLAPALPQLPLYAQHIDPMDTGTLVDIFRAEPNASLMGTDALRDGVDIPGQSLRMVILEGVPWPRPTLLYGARKKAFGGVRYEDHITRARLAQAFGRLIRRQTDRGVFVLLGAAVPSRLLTAFPTGAMVQRVSLNEAIAQSHIFLHGSSPGE